jgi:hypothetical protein
MRFAEAEAAVWYALSWDCKREHSVRHGAPGGGGAHSVEVWVEVMVFLEGRLGAETDVDSRKTNITPQRFHHEILAIEASRLEQDLGAGVCCR